MDQYKTLRFMTHITNSNSTKIMRYYLQQILTKSHTKSCILRDQSKNITCRHVTNTITIPKIMHSTRCDKINKFIKIHIL